MIAFLYTYNNFLVNGYILSSYLPTPPLRQDMTQGQFYAAFNGFEFRVFPSLTSCLTKAEEPSLAYYLLIAGGE